MDNSSRNIVSFIATITIAALVLMGAHFYAQSGDKTPVTEDTNAVTQVLPENAVPANESDLAEAALDEVEDDDAIIREAEVTVEPIESITGEPSATVQAATATP
jgi:hypothetical protein